MDSRVFKFHDDFEKLKIDLELQKFKNYYF